MVFVDLIFKWLVSTVNVPLKFPRRGFKGNEIVLYGQL